MAPKKKKVAGLIKLQIQAGQANPAPPVGPALGQHGVNIMEFCKAYNAATENQRGNVVPVEITVYEDRSFTFQLKTPPAAKLLLKAAARRQGLGRAAPQQGREGHVGPGPRNRRDQEGRPQRQRHRRRRQDHRRHRPVDGHHGRVVADVWEGQLRPARPQPNDRLDEPMSKKSKAYRAAAEKVDRTRLYTPLEATRLAKETSSKNQDATVEVAIRLGVDPRKADQMVRGTVNLPNGTGKTARVAVFAVGDKAEQALAAGADIVGSDDLIERIQGGFLDFDAAIATPDQMAKVGRIARILGPRGLMPNPKTGTVTADVAKAVADIKGGKINFRVDKQANLHLVIGKASFNENKLVENYGAALEEILRAKPSSSKGRYLKKVTVSTTTGPGIPVDPQVTRNFAEA